MVSHSTGSIGSAPEVCQHAKVGVMPMALSAAGEGGTSESAWGWAIEGVDECDSVCSAWCRCACNEGPIQQYRCYNGVLISDAVRC